MDLMRFFKQVPSLAAEDVRKFLGERKPGEYNVIDVRQPGEYEHGHQPGAELMAFGIRQCTVAPRGRFDR
jgi:rhodanese-related sulfurtransferase